MPNAHAALAKQAFACVDDEEVIEKTPAHIDAQVMQPKAAVLPPFRARPQLEIDDWLSVRPNLASLFATSGMIWRGCRCLGVR